MFCDECGKAVPGNVDFCPNCGKDLSGFFDDLDVKKYTGGTQEPPVEPRRQTAPPTQPRRTAQPNRAGAQSGRQTAQRSSGGQSRQAAPRNTTRRPTFTNIRMSENEEMIREYFCTRIKRSNGMGFLTVTNKRMIFHTNGDGVFANRVVKEVSLDKVTGLDCYSGQEVRPIKMFLGILLFIFSFAIRSEMQGLRFLKKSLIFLVFIALLVLALWMIFTAFRKCFKLQIYASDCEPSPIRMGAASAKMGAMASDALYEIDGLPTEETEQMMDELGAMVHDIQTMGDLAVAKWKK